MELDPKEEGHANAENELVCPGRAPAPASAVDEPQEGPVVAALRRSSSASLGASSAARPEPDAEGALSVQHSPAALGPTTRPEVWPGGRCSEARKPPAEVWDGGESEREQRSDLVREPLLRETGSEVQSGPGEARDRLSESWSAGLLLSLVEETKGNPDSLNRNGLAVSESTDECPICTELYESQGDRLRALLHCHHTVCQRCLAALQQRATDRSRVCCPLCRQKTPLPQWEIRSMQEELMSHMGTSSPSTPQPTPSSSALPPRQRGLCANVERQLVSRLETGRACGCFPYPPGLLRFIRALRPRCRCCHLVALLLLHLAELSCLLLVFLPVIVLVLLFTLVSK